MIEKVSSGVLYYRVLWGTLDNRVSGVCVEI